MVRLLDRTPRGRALLLPVALATLFSTGAIGGEQGDPTTPITPAPLAAAADMPFDIAVGIALTTNYVSRGITNSNSDPAVQGYIEPSVELGDFGAFEVRERRARWGRNPRTGEALQVPAKFYAAFQTGHRLRKRVAELPKIPGGESPNQEWDEWAD